jgi:hypothetical protein
MPELLVACIVYVVVVYPTIKLVAAARRGESVGLGGITVVGD